MGIEQYAKTRSICLRRPNFQILGTLRYLTLTFLFGMFLLCGHHCKKTRVKLFAIFL